MERAPNRTEPFPRISPVIDFCLHNQYFMCDECSRIFLKGQAAERERCAKIAEEIQAKAERYHDTSDGALIAAAIRSGR
jgi:hypothetical protein